MFRDDRTVYTRLAELSQSPVAVFQPDPSRLTYGGMVDSLREFGHALTEDPTQIPARMQAKPNALTMHHGGYMEVRTMSILEFSVQVQHPGKENSTIRLACKLAQRLQAHLNGIHAAPLPTAAFAIPEAVTAQVMEAERSRHAAEGKAEWWQKTLESYDLHGNWRVGEGDVGQVLCLAAASSNLVIMEHSIDMEDGPLGFGATSRTIFAANRPVLLIPADTPLAETGHRVLVAWNGSLEATRALTGAVPILAQAEQVCILDGHTDTGPDGLTWLPSLDLTDWCSRHAIFAELLHFEPVKPAAAELLQFAAEMRADLIVLGAWGHSRLAEMILGGVTRNLLREAHLPMLMAH